MVVIVEAVGANECGGALAVKLGDGGGRVCGLSYLMRLLGFCCVLVFGGLESIEAMDGVAASEGFRPFGSRLASVGYRSSIFVF